MHIANLFKIAVRAKKGTPKSTLKLRWYAIKTSDFSQEETVLLPRFKMTPEFVILKPGQTQYFRLEFAEEKYKEFTGDLFGHGVLGSYPYVNTYPHNIVLEFLFSFGWVWGIAFLFCIGRLVSLLLLDINRSVLTTVFQLYPIHPFYKAIFLIYILVECNP